MSEKLARGQRPLREFSCEMCPTVFESRGPVSGPNRTKFCPDCRRIVKNGSSARTAAARQATYRARNGGNGWSNHGVTEGQYAELYVKQGGRCAVCAVEKGPEWKRGNLELDHCHETGEVRGLLCGDCNTAAGRVGDNSAILRLLADYIDNSRSGIYSKQVNG